MTELENALVNAMGVISLLALAFIWFLKLGLGILIVTIIWSILEEIIWFIKKIIKGR